MNNSRFDLPARNSIPVNEPGSAAYRRLQRAKKARPVVEKKLSDHGWKGKPAGKGSKVSTPNTVNVQRRVRGKQR